MRDSGSTSQRLKTAARGEGAALARRPGEFGLAEAPTVSAALIADVIQRVASSQRPQSPALRAPAVSSEQIDALCDALAGDDPHAASRLIMRAEAEGVSPDTLFLDYIAAAARRMGERWTEDCASFLDVSLAGTRLTSIVRQLATMFSGPQAETLPGHTMLITTVPGETHSLGAAIAAECFQRSRWQVRLLDGAGMREIEEALARDCPAVLGLAAGSRRMVPVLTETVNAVRAKYPDIMIVIGGPILMLEPEIVAMVGADLAAEDPAVLSVMLRRHITVTTLGEGCQE